MEDEHDDIGGSSESNLHSSTDSPSKKLDLTDVSYAQADATPETQLPESTFGTNSLVGSSVLVEQESETPEQNIPVSDTDPLDGSHTFEFDADYEQLPQIDRLQEPDSLKASTIPNVDDPLASETFPSTNHEQVATHDSGAQLDDLEKGIYERASPSEHADPTVVSYSENDPLSLEAQILSELNVDHKPDDMKTVQLLDESHDHEEHMVDSVSVLPGSKPDSTSSNDGFSAQERDEEFNAEERNTIEETMKSKEPDSKEFDVHTNIQLENIPEPEQQMLMATGDDVQSREHLTIDNAFTHEEHISNDDASSLVNHYDDDEYLNVISTAFVLDSVGNEMTDVDNVRVNDHILDSEATSAETTAGEVTTEPTDHGQEDLNGFAEGMTPLVTLDREREQNTLEREPGEPVLDVLSSLLIPDSVIFYWRWIWTYDADKPQNAILHGLQLVLIATFTCLSWPVRFCYKCSFYF